MGVRKEPGKDYVLTSPKGEEIATWDDQPLTLSLVHHMVNEAYTAGYNKAGKQLDAIKKVLRDEPR